MGLYEPYLIDKKKRVPEGTPNTTTMKNYF